MHNPRSEGRLYYYYFDVAWVAIWQPYCQKIGFPAITVNNLSSVTVDMYYI